jgi:NADH dehydrogenase/NADH:ubiquinone oxidoreductase subunit G
MRSIFYFPIFSILLAISYSNCTDKKGDALLNSYDEKLAQRIAKSTDFKQKQKVLKNIIQESRNILNQTPEFEDYVVQLKSLKENPSYTEKEISDSAAKMKSAILNKTTMSQRWKELMKESAELSNKINEEFPELISMAPDRKKAITLRAMIIDQTYIKPD